MAQQTTLWGYGGPGHLYGSFAGKSAATAATGAPSGGMNLAVLELLETAIFIAFIVLGL